MGGGGEVPQTDSGPDHEKNIDGCITDKKIRLSHAGNWRIGPPCVFVSLPLHCGVK